MGYEQNLIHRYNYWELFLHPDQRYLGRCYAWIRRNTSMLDLTDLTRSEHEELFGRVIPQWKEAVGFLWQPDLYNYAWFGNDVRDHDGHGHMHLIPHYKYPKTRYEHRFEDMRWGKNYAPYDPFPLSAQLMRVIRDDIKQAMDITKLADWAAKKITSS